VTGSFARFVVDDVPKDDFLNDIRLGQGRNVHLQPVHAADYSWYRDFTTSICANRVGSEDIASPQVFALVHYIRRSD